MILELKFLPLEDIRCILGFLNGFQISKLLLCGDKRIEYLIMKGGAVDSLSFNFPVDSLRTQLPQFVYRLENLKILAISADKSEVSGIDIHRLPSSLQILSLRFWKSPHAFWSHTKNGTVVCLNKSLPNLRELEVHASTYCCNPSDLILNLPASITRLELLKMDAKYLYQLPPTLVDLETAFTSYKWDAQAGKLPNSLERLILHDVKHGRFMAALPPNLRVLTINWNVYMRSDTIFDDDMSETEGWNFLPGNLETFETSTGSMTAKRVKYLPRKLIRLTIVEEATPSRALDWLPFLPSDLMLLECPLSTRVEEVVTRVIARTRDDSRLAKDEALEIILAALPRRLRALPRALGPIRTLSQLKYLSPGIEALTTSDMPEKGLSLILSRFPLRQLTCSGISGPKLREVVLPIQLERLTFNIAISRPLQWKQISLTALSLTQITDSAILNQLPTSLKLLNIGLREVKLDVNLTYLKALLQISIRFIDTEASAPQISFVQTLPITLGNLQLVYAGKNALPGDTLAELGYLKNLHILHIGPLCAITNDHLAQLPPKLHHLVINGPPHQLAKDCLDVLPASLTKIVMPPPLLDFSVKQCRRFRNLLQLVMGVPSPALVKQDFNWTVFNLDCQNWGPNTR